MKLEPSTPCRIETLVEHAIRLRNLLTLAIDAPEIIESTQLTHPDYLEEGLHGTKRPVVFELLRQWDANPPQYPKRDVQHFDMLFTLSDLGGLVGISNWLELSAKYDWVVQDALAMQLMPAQFVDARFLSVAVSADALARIHSSGSVTTYRQRLIYLGDLACEIFADLVGDVELWTANVKEQRNNIAHGEHKSAYQQYRPPLGLLSSSVYYLVIFCLMRLLDVDDSALDGVRGKIWYWQLQKMFQHYSS